ncbi:hypothetical protein H5410_061826 [Solanum commersonii]|uniref:Uncharacterized protein n=1 Tax=Solanum commersonii TaxID=4109 RepID=A0A9J5W9X7_SOLCO|nr:hypothetical protein H5410_061826 [Solanum commersonii]
MVDKYGRLREEKGKGSFGSSCTFDGKLTLEEIFLEFEITPTIEEIVSFMGKRSSILDSVDCNKFLVLVKINEIKKESLKNRYRKKDDFDKYQKQLSNQGIMEACKVNGRFAFMHINIRLAGVVKALIKMENPTIIPMILANILRALTKSEKGVVFEHLYHHNHAPRLTPNWSNYISIHKDRVAKVYFPKRILACEENSRC